MLKNLIKISIRNILKEKGYSVLNILGLAIGITSSIFLLLYVMDELSYDMYHEKADQIYRLNSHISEPTKSFIWNVAQPPAGPGLTEEFPVIENYTRLFGRGRTLFKVDDKEIYQRQIYGADSTFFDLFTYKFLEGNPETALVGVNSLVLTKSLSIALFGEEPALDKLVAGAGDNTYKVTAVIEDVPLNSHLRFNALFSLDERERNADGWGGFYVYTYYLLPKNYDIAELNAQMPAMYDKYMKEIFEEIGIDIQYEFQPLSKIHLYSETEGEAGGDIRYIYIFIAVAIFMLLIASINYTNLATARSVYRAKEVGIRKVMGSLRKQLIIQFLSESIVLTFIAMMISFVFFAVALPYFNEVAGKEISLTYLFQNNLPIVLLAIVLVLGLLGGSYPAFMLSSFQPVQVLKGKVSSKGGKAAFRKILVVLQFSISLGMLVCTKIVYDQLAYMQSKDLGYDQSQVMSFYLPRGQSDKYEVLQNSLSQYQSIEKIGNASQIAGNIDGRQITALEGENGMEEIAVKRFVFNESYMETMGMQIVEGRGFSLDYPADTLQSVLVNEALVKRMSWKEALGKKVTINTREEEHTAQVVGVVKDFHPVSLYEKIEPMVMYYNKNMPAVHIKVSAENIPQAIADIEKTFKEIFPGRPFEYDFLDQDFLSNYETDINRGKIFTTFAFLTMIIACLGLLGLASYTAEQRAKEIGIRKVIGAKVTEIIFMVSRDFVLLVALSLLVAFPISWYFMDQWLEVFAYRTEIKPLSFVIAAVLTLVITIVTVSYHTFRAATTNPVKVLKSE